ncbi:hypothetical protein [Streptomyces griseoruber]
MTSHHNDTLGFAEQPLQRHEGAAAADGARSQLPGAACQILVQPVPPG